MTSHLNPTSMILGISYFFRGCWKKQYVDLVTWNHPNFSEVIPCWENQPLRQWWKRWKVGTQQLEHSHFRFYQQANTRNFRFIYGLDNCLGAWLKGVCVKKPFLVNRTYKLQCYCIIPTGKNRCQSTLIKCNESEGGQTRQQGCDIVVKTYNITLIIMLGWSNTVVITVITVDGRNPKQPPEM